MPTELTQTQLSRLADEIRGYHDAAISSARTAIAAARACGERLTEAKALVPHGEWLPWLEANTNVSERTAQKWMRLAAAGGEIEDTGGIERALDAMAEPKSAVTADLPEAIADEEIVHPLWVDPNQGSLTPTQNPDGTWPRPEGLPPDAHWLPDMLPGAAPGAAEREAAVVDAASAKRNPQPRIDPTTRRLAELAEHVRYFAELSDWDSITDGMYDGGGPAPKGIRLLYAAAWNLAGLAEQVDHMFKEKRALDRVQRNWLRGTRDARWHPDGWWEWNEDDEPEPEPAAESKDGA